MKNFLINTIGLLLTTLCIRSTHGAAFRGRDISQAYLTNQTFAFEYDNMYDLFVFGDGYSDVNTNLKDMKYDKTVNGGKNWALKLVDIPDHKYNLWDFAHNNAVVDLNLVPRQPEDTSFVTQYEQFVENKHKKNRGWNSRNSLFAIWFGMNDILDLKRSDGNSDNEALDNIISTYFQTVEDLYKHGARSFLLIYVPTIGKAPINKDNSKLFADSDTTYFNSQIKEKAREFFNQHQDTNVLVYDAYMEFNYLMENRSSFGIENTTDSCLKSGASNCGTKDETHFWHSDILPSYRVQEALGRDIHEFLTAHQVFRNANSDSSAISLKVGIKSLFLCSAAIILLFLL